MPRLQNVPACTDGLGWPAQRNHDQLLPTLPPFLTAASPMGWETSGAVRERVGSGPAGMGVAAIHSGRLEEIA